MFLDEIGDLHLSLQAKLLHVLQDGAFCRVGGRSTRKADVRIVAATNRDLEVDVARRPVPGGSLLPPQRRPDRRPAPSRAHGGDPAPDRLLRQALRAALRARGVHGLAGRHGAADAPRVPRQRPRAREHRQADGRAERPAPRARALSACAADRAIEEPRRSPSPLPDGVSLKEIARAAARAAEREAIARVLKETRWNRVRAAELLGISYRALLYKIKDVGLRGASAPRLGQREAS